jgi:hypothetical protein
VNFQKFKKEYLNFKKIFSNFSVFLDSYLKLLFVVFSSGIIFFGIYFWYGILYKSEWGDEEKNQYKNIQDKRIQLKEKELKSVMEESERRKSKYEEPIRITRNIFVPYADEGKNSLNDTENSSGLSSNSDASSESGATSTFPW